MLKEKYRLKYIKDVIIYFNSKKSLESRFDLDFIQDIDLEPYSDYELFVL